jgi:hypothetical protein
MLGEKIFHIPQKWGKNSGATDRESQARQGFSREWRAKYSKKKG